MLNKILRRSKVALSLIALFFLQANFLFPVYSVLSSGNLVHAGNNHGGGQETCPDGGDWHKVDGLSGTTYTYNAPDGYLIEEWCYKASTEVRYGDVIPPQVSYTVESTVENHHGNIQELSHASFRLVSEDTDESVYLTIRKNIVNNDASNDSTLFPITLSGENIGSISEVSPLTEIELVEGESYTVNEVLSKDSEYQSLNCNNLLLEVSDGEIYANGRYLHHNTLVCNNELMETEPENVKFIVLKDILGYDDDMTPFSINIYKGESLFVTKTIVEGDPWQGSDILELEPGTYFVSEVLDSESPFRSLTCNNLQFVVHENGLVTGVGVHDYDELLGAQTVTCQNELKEVEPDIFALNITKDVVGRNDATEFEVMINSEELEEPFSGIISEGSWYKQYLEIGSYNINEVLGEESDYTSLSCNNLPITVTVEGIDGEGITFDEETGEYYLTCLNEIEEDEVVPTQSDLILSKVNNSGGVGLHPGAMVLYTLTVTAPVIEEDAPADLSNPYVLENVKVTDIAPAGFAYVSGSWSATLNGVPLTVSDPIYNNLGVWNVGTMHEGDVVQLSYLTKISLDQDPGLYKDLAWTEGTDNQTDESARVLGNDDSGVFVGTEVRVISDVEPAKAEVLGVSLPDTGAKGVWTVSALFMIVVGAYLLFADVDKKKKSKFSYSLISFLTILMMVLPVTPLYAVTSSLSVNIEQPKSPFIEKDLKVGFVALDFEGRSVSVRCYKKGPEDAGFVTLGSAINLGNGGGNGDCVAGQAVINVEGTYSFKVVATAGSDIVNSNDVSVVIDTNAPGSVSEYRNTKNSCKYELSFRTANDGQTSGVQIFRSVSKSFVADSSTLITTISASPNQIVSYSDTIPDCSQTYYYAARAIDASGNSSGLTTDTIVTVVPGNVDNGGTADGDVEGVDDENSNGGDDNGATGEDDGEVIGGSDNENDDDQDKDSDNEDKNEDEDNGITFWDWFKYALAGAGLITIAGVIYLYATKKLPKIEFVYRKKK